jgi:VanZ family protein
MKFGYVLFILIYLCVLTFLLLHPATNSGVLPKVWTTFYYIEPLLPATVSLIHFIAFLPLSFCISQISGKKSIWVWFLFLIVYAIATELLQEYIPPRAFRYDDLSQNIAGIVVGLFFGYYLKHVHNTISDYSDDQQKGTTNEH